MRKFILFAVLGLISICVSAVTVADNATFIDTSPHRPVDPDKAKRGYLFLQQLPLGDEILKLPDLENLYTTWDGDDGEKAKTASPEELRKLAYARYGFVDAPYENYGLPMGLVYDANTHGVHLNCLFCHSGSIRGKVVPGLPNQRMDLATLIEDVAVLKYKAKGVQLGRPLAVRGVAGEHSSRTRGGSNVWIEESDLLNGRTPELRPNGQSLTGPWQNFDTTPSPYWNIKKKTRLYHAGFISVGPRPPMLAVLYDKALTAEQLTAHLPDFEDVANWLDSVEVPKYPGPVNAELAAQGKTVFEKSCAGCHGTYGEHPTFPNVDIPIAKIGTDPVDLIGKGDFIGAYYKSWFNKFGLDPKSAPASNFVKYDKLGSSGKFDGVDSKGPLGLGRQSYIAPPLDGIWASAPYLHNGSVPTLFHLLHPDQRPAVWKVTDYDGYDDHRVGLPVEELAAIPVIQSMTASDRRRYFDTSVYGQTNVGHPFANQLTEEERTAVLEYLKTL
jgi:mono/diheme cytochrome c family protein